MENLLSNQQLIIDAIDQLYVNFKKDGKDRKSVDYINRKVTTLDGYWQEFHNNHVQLWAYPNKSDDYFTNNVYDLTKNKYEKIRSTIQAYDPKTETRPSSPVLKPATPMATTSFSASQKTLSQGTDSKTDELLKKQASNFRAFQRTLSSIDLGSVKEKWEFEDLLSSLKSRWSAIDSLHWEIDSETQGSNEDYERAYSSHEASYNNIKRSINSKLWSESHRDKTTPKMDVPTFHGNYHQWVSFKDLFTEVIHRNASLSNAQKMQFLKGKVRGEAERLIQHLSISSDNYETCWEILNHRYNNKKLIFTSYLNNLMNIPTMQQPTINHIKRLHDTTLETLNAVKNLGVDISTWDPLLVYLLSQKLDSESHTDYNESLKQPRELPTIQDFLEFLEAKFTSMESSRRKQDFSTNKAVTSQPTRYQKSNHQSFSNYKPAERTINRNQSKFKCPLCNNDHGLYYCQKFLAMSPQHKKSTVSRLQLCPNCLFNHHGKVCTSEKRCRECQASHNTILHEAYMHHNNEKQPSMSRAANHTSKSINESHQDDSSEILLATAIVQVQAADGTYIKLRALLDQGSQSSIISHRASQLLSLPIRKCKGVLVGIGAKENNCKGATTITMKSTKGDYTLETDIFIMKTLINNLPSYTIPKPSWEFLNNIELADPEFYVSRPIDLLLGAEVYSHILLNGICRADNQSPIAQQTRFGWIISGSVNTRQFHCNVILNDTDSIQKFWEIEDISSSSTSTLSAEDQACIDFYKQTTIRREDGSYQVKLPLKSELIHKLGTSKQKAVAQLLQLERKFTKNDKFATDYKLFMQEYLAAGYMKPADGNKTPNYYLPHHGVQRAESLTTSLRVVYNGSAPTSSGLSLNDIMYRGPNLQQDLQSLILKWRQYRFAYTADIQKMFCQIWLNEDDQHFQKIVWRDDSNKPLQDYQLTTVSFGIKAAPFLAMMTLKQLASDEKLNYTSSDAIKVLEECLYMDDLIHGNHSPSSALQLKADITKLLKSGGFNLRKWASNVPQLLENQSDQASLDFREVNSTKTLGLRWNPVEDNFRSRVVELHPGKDNYVRVVTVKTKNGFLKRPIIKLSILPVHPSAANNEPTEQQSSKNQEKRKPTYTNFSSFVLLLLSFLSIFTTTQATLNVTALKPNQGLYFDKISSMQLIRDEWKIVTYYDMNPYWQANSACDKYLKYLNKLCVNLKNTHCDVITMQLQHEYSELDYYHHLLHSQQASTRRSKRGLINGIGYLAHSLFGVLDERFAEQYTSDILSLRNNQDHLLKLIQNQTSVVESEYNVLKRTENVIEKQHKALNKLIINQDNLASTLKSESERNSLMNDFSLISIASSNLLRSLKGMQNTILDTITDIYHGRMSFQLITPDQLKAVLNTISSHISKDLLLPISNLESDFSKIYHFIKVKARMCEEFLIFELRVPLVYRDSYEIMKIIPVPRAVDNMKMVSVSPISEYIAINLKKDSYLTMTTYDVRACLHDKTDTYLCYIQRPIYHLKNDDQLCLNEPSTEQCKISMTPCSNQWTETSKPNKYLFFCCDTCPIKILCDNQVFAKSLSSAGIISVDRTCIIKTEQFTIFSHNQGMSQINVSSALPVEDIEPINHIINIDISPSTLQNSLNLPNKEMEDIKSEIKTLKTNEHLPEQISSHDIHHYAVIYGCVCITVIVSLIAWLRRIRSKRLTTRVGDADAAPDHLQTEMRPMSREARPTSGEQSTPSGKAYHVSGQVRFPPGQAEAEYQTAGTQPELWQPATSRRVTSVGECVGQGNMGICRSASVSEKCVVKVDKSTSPHLGLTLTHKF